MKLHFPLAGICAALVLQACDRDTVAGTNNETHTKGTFYQANGKPAVGARVRVYSAAQKETDSTTAQVAQEYVDANGNVKLELKPGHYSLVADSGSISTFIDSVFSDGDKVAIPVDTLRPTGTITGYVRVQPMHSPSIAWVHLMRTNLYTKVDSRGFFQLSNVPTGALDLVAVSHLPEYTPTHKLVHARPDSTVDVDTIDLVYNGLPLVTGIDATYDTLSGVVTLTWHDTAYARKAGYVIYRQDGTSSWMSPPEHGYAESPIFRDTVFGGFGATPSRYDSAEFDLTYWVGAKGTDQISRGPIWNKVSLHAKSPALAKRWKNDWQTIPNVTIRNETVLDTIQGKLGILKVDDSVATMQIVGKDGSSSTTRFAVPSELQSGPIFWQGKLWMAKGYAPTATVHDNWPIGDSIITVATWQFFDSIRIMSSSDGSKWDSTSIATSKDSVDGFQLRVGEHGLVLVSGYFREYMGTSGGPHGALIEAVESPDGIEWAPLPESRIFLTNVADYHNNWLFLSPIKTVTIRRTGDGNAWSQFSNNETSYSISGYTTSTWIIPGQSVDTASAVLKIPGLSSVKAKSNLFVFDKGGVLNLASPLSPTLWQRIEPPEPVVDFCFWQDKLVFLGETGLHFATITPNQ